MNTKKTAWEEIKATLIWLTICIVITGLVFSLSLERSWIFYDEDMIYNETFAPTPTSLSEALETLKTFGFINNIGSNNFLYSSNIVNRTSVFATPLYSLLGLMFKKSAVLYHIANLAFHLINSVLVFLTLNVIFKSRVNIFTISILTLFWALHPVQVESILLSTNIGATISYMFYFLLFYDFIKNKDNIPTIARKFTIPILFILPMLLNEYIIALPFIIFTFSFLDHLRTNGFRDSVKKTFTKCFPYLIGILIYLLYFLFSNYSFFQTLSSNLRVTLERIFWLSPQIIAHHLKLIFTPITLSIDQSAHVKISNDLFGTYPIICSVSLLLILFVPLIIYLITRKSFPLTLCSLLIFISLIPFSQILSPTYALSAERYLYTPLFFVTIALGFLLLKLEDTRVSNKIFLTLLSFLLVILITRTIVRINDWKNNEKLLTSTIQSSPNKLYKGFRTQTLAKVYSAKGQSTKSKLLFDKADNYIAQSIISYQKSRVKEPLILKAYGLDAHSLLLKAGYQKCIDKFVKDKSNTKACLAFFNENIQDISKMDPATLELYANLILENGDKAKAKDLFLYAYNKYPKVPFLLVSLIRFERDIENNLEATKKYVEKARGLFPYSKDILFEALRYHQNAGNFEEYIHHAYLYGLRAHSKFTYLEALTGYLKLNMREKAKLTIDKLLRLDPTDPKIFYMASNFYIKEQDYERAVALLQEGKMNLKEEEDNDLAFKINSTLAELHHAQNNYQQAIFYAQEALKYAYGNPRNIAKVKELITKLEI